MEININFLIVLLISIITFIADTFIYVLKLNYWIAIIISVILVIISSIFIKKKCKIKIKFDFHPMDLIFIVLLLFTMSIKIFFQDESYDVNMYHIYLQENPFTDKINFDFFPARISSYLFPLGDRMFYLSRMILGYRLGTLLSYYTYIVLFYQTKNLINLFTNNKNRIKASFFATLIYFISIIKEVAGTYYIDNLSTIFILEIVYLVFGESEFFKNKFKLCFSFLLSGIAFGIKITNLILIVPIYVYAFIKNYKDFRQIKLKNILTSIVLFLAPFSVYMLYNFLQTGNPIFPFCNNIFKSVWYRLGSPTEPKYVLQNKLYAFIWPIEVILNPIKTYDFAIIDYLWGIGYVVTILHIVKAFVFKEKDRLFEFSIISFVLSIIWAIMLRGYLRYATILPILYVAIIGSIFINVSFKNKFIKFLYVVFACCIIIATIYPERKEIIKDIKDSKMLVEAGLKYNTIFFDRSKDKIHIDGAWVTAGDDSKLVTLAREDGTPIYNLEEKFLKSDLIIGKREELIHKDLYTLIDFWNKEKKIKFLENNNFELVELVCTVYLDCLAKDTPVEVYKIKYIEKENKE